MKKVLKFLGLFLLVGGALYVWQVHFNYRFETISDNRVYKSALIHPDRLEDFLVDNNIKTVVDLLDPGVQDALNPAKQAEINAEDKAINKINEKYNLNIKHVNIPSGQVPTKATLTKFFEVLDREESYPILIHCYHGTGRAQMYSALYRVEYEQWSNSDARAKTRVVVEGLGYRSSFSDGKEKGDFLMSYKARNSGEHSTFNILDK
ncbi:MAG: Protein phosphatase [uncultured Sulfurovum sp.]|uniref:Protein phosphatase n=1 Tax=uncultured Sulfurovum sp. TaxID=269237 RepID=A0A6S6S707_9BACT|nr:MAG: Protein phosphatase [uncultured Sulfurovum sp.]